MTRAVLIAGAVVAAAASAQAGMVTTFYYSNAVNDGLSGYNIADLTAEVTFDFTNDNPGPGGNLSITVLNTSGNPSIDAQLGALFWNSPSAGDLTLNSFTTNDSTYDTIGVGDIVLSTNAQADGFQSFGYKIDFRPENLIMGTDKALSPGNYITFNLSYTGTMSLTELENTFTHSNTFGDTLSVVEWFPNAGTGFAGGGTDPFIPGVPEPSSLLLAGLGAFAGLGLRRRRRLSETSQSA